MRQGHPMTYYFLAALTLGALCLLPMSDANAADKDHPVVVLDTTMGPITVELDRTKAPITVDNFLKYLDDGFFDGTIFHRIIPDFMIQGGGYTADMEKKRTNPPIRNESGNGLSNTKGTIAMGLLPNQQNSATSQFYINLRDNPHLDGQAGRPGSGYAVFGKVIDGGDIVDKMALVPTATRGFNENVPVQPIQIKSAKRKGS